MKIEVDGNPKIAIIGTGYVGLSTALILAKQGCGVYCTDVDRQKVDSLEKGISPVYEPGFEELLQDMKQAGRLHPTTDIQGAIAASSISFICVGTPSKEDSSIDLSYIVNAANMIGKALANKDGYHLVVVKSTVVPTTTKKLVLPELEKASGKKAGKDFGVSMNPEFLREGSALQDAQEPDRIVIGEMDEGAGAVLAKLYEQYDCPVLHTDLDTAEMIKYTSNSFLATKISFANEIGNICEGFGIDVYEVMKGVGLDSRISPQFLRAGAGWGGSCFPKDVMALVAAARENGTDPILLSKVLEQNQVQPLRLIDLATKALGDLAGKRIAVLGLAFKPDTDDVRHTRALPLIRGLLDKGVMVSAYDPKASENFKLLLDEEERSIIIFTNTALDALDGAEACIIQTEWQEFRDFSPKDLVSAMARPVVVDGRRTLDPVRFINGGVKYLGIGWKND